MTTPTILCVLFQGEHVPAHSRGIYDASWVDKLYRGVARNTMVPFRFVCLVNQPYDFEEDVTSVRLWDPEEEWMAINEIYRNDLGVERGVFFGLDTIIVGNLDELLTWSGDFGLLSDPFRHQTICNGIVSFGRAWADRLWDDWNEDREKIRATCQINGSPSEMAFLRQRKDPAWVLLDKTWPGRFLSYKASGLKHQEMISEEARVVYFHGKPKPHQLPEASPLLEHWT
jgi:hypothetical protein